MRKFSDFAKNDDKLIGEKINITEIFNKPIEVENFRMLTSKDTNKPLLHLQFKLNGERRTTFTNSTVLIRQCEESKSYMPFEATIKKINKYYTFT